MFAVVEDGKMGKGHSNLYIYIIHIIPYDLNYDPTIESLNHCTFFVQLVFFFVVDATPIADCPHLGRSDLVKSHLLMVAFPVFAYSCCLDNIK